MTEHAVGKPILHVAGVCLAECSVRRSYLAECLELCIMLGRNMTGCCLA